MQETCKIWWDEQRQYFRMFLPDGTEIPRLCAVSVKDNWQTGGNMPTAQLEVYVEVVKDQPEKSIQ